MGDCSLLINNYLMKSSFADDSKIPVNRQNPTKTTPISIQNNSTLISQAWW